MTHEKVICSCGKTIRNCRCPGQIDTTTGTRTKPIRVITNGCSRCKFAYIADVEESIAQDMAARSKPFAVPSRIS